MKKDKSILGKYILWYPTSMTPPQRVYDTYQEAVDMAKVTVENYEGGKVFVARLGAIAELAQPPVNVTTMWEKEV